MRKRFWIPPVLIAAAAIGFFGFAPGFVEKSMNQIDGKPLIKVSDEAKTLHKTLTIVDLHSDTLMWNRDLNDRASRGHMDVPRLQDGNVALQLFSSVSKTPKNQNYDGNGADSDNITLLTIAQLQPMKTWSSLVERSLYHAHKRDAAVAGSNGLVMAVNTSAQLDGLLAARAKGPRPVGAMLTIEGLQNLEGKAANLDRLYAAGFRMAGLTHFFDNELAGSMHGLKKGGLTPFGRDIVRRMEAKGMIVDIAHLSHTGVAEVLAMARRPVVSSHGGVQATCKVNRNLTDDEIRGVAKTGGVIGIGYWDAAICDTSPRAAAKAIKHVRDLVGIAHVALGSDYDGATTVRFDTSQLVQVTQALLDEGFTPEEIRAVMGENALRVIKAGLKPLAESPTTP
ncbi:peptidase M19 [Sphingorhabdus sp. IMCC26285]|uniref:Peptidase M19 n=1 Tax=Sphingorhabdus profundilacus TaxID=2509718 RepID=A0A6I4M8W7_9SPHN|nr:dipeptidase [Sphingorhabdus profundilacus]MVZ98545.1 peptidase M19 [Sphingorhabdus profundilacus]